MPFRSPFKNEKLNFSKPMIIAEIGNNHEGSFKIAKKLILQAKKTGVDAVKFQTYITDDFIHRKEKKRYRTLKSFQLSQNDFIKLKKIAKKHKLKFISTPFDFESAKFLNKLVDYFKVASSDNNFYQLISYILSYNKPVIISLGFLKLSEILKLEKFILKEIKILKFTKTVHFLYCVSSYPVKNKDINLNNILILKRKLKIPIGFSDHTVGLDSSYLASILGAKIIEKHFTLSKKFSNFRDHLLSSDPKEMKLLVQMIKKIPVLLGNKKRTITKDEMKIARNSRRSIYLRKDLKKGERLKKDHIKFLRPFKNSKPNDFNFILNRKAKKNLNKGKEITKNLF